MYVLKYSSLGDIIKTGFSAEVLGKLLVSVGRFPIPKYHEAGYGGGVGTGERQPSSGGASEAQRLEMG